MQQNRIRLKDVAEAAQVSVATVSLALRGHRRIPAETREMIRKLARRLGYRPDPAMGALAAYRNRAGNRAPSLECLALLRRRKEEETDREVELVAGMVAGLETGSGEAGFHLEGFACPEEPRLVRALLRTLHQRGMAGIFLDAGSAELVAEAGMGAWERMPAVVLDPSGRPGNFPVVALDAAGNGLRLARSLVEAGYRRPALAWGKETPPLLAAWWETALRLGWPGGFAGETFPREAEAADLRAWLDRHQPDVVVATDPEVEERLAAVGRRVPLEIGVVLAECAGRPERFTGIRTNLGGLGAKAVELMRELVFRGEPPAEDALGRYALAGVWQVGKTARSPVPGVASEN
ncbi:MAG: LacI family transcriptional regulator [Puniceicoccaceae bacterium]|nr:MAG: LacI family transcriptional regulator [Puniceicoccaceae bacterium]